MKEDVSMRSGPIVALVALLGAAPALAERPYLVKDIEPLRQNGDSNPHSFYVLENGISLFFANDGEHDNELWRSDGTPGGTYLLQESCPGNCRRSLWFIGLGGDRAFFMMAEDDGFYLWGTGGSPGDTFRLAGPFSPDPIILSTWMESERVLYFAPTDTQHGNELWRSDGTTKGTVPLSLDRNAFTEGLFFFTPDLHAPIWRTDGTSAGTFRIHPSGVSVGQGLFHAIGKTVFFPARTEGGGDEIWTTDGTVEGTQRVTEESPSRTIRGMTVFGGKLYFTVESFSPARRIWRTDGTPEGTEEVATFDVSTYSDPEILGTHGGRLWFLLRDPELGRELWSTDGTSSGTRMLADLVPGYGDPNFFKLVSAGSWMLIEEDEGLWRSDGTAAGTRKLTDRTLWSPESGPDTAVVQGRVFFVTISQNQEELWQSDGTEAGTRPVVDALGQHITRPQDLTSFGGRLYFIQGGMLWRTDGTDLGTVPIHLDGLHSPQELTAAGGRLFFRVTDNEHGTEIWALEP
jgi:ELWxxDGT repeat protein